jgi:hypothetical protein
VLGPRLRAVRRRGRIAGEGGVGSFSDWGVVVSRWPVRLLAVLAFSAAVVCGLAATVRGGWLGGSVGADPVALARLAVPGLGGRVSSVRVVDAHGHPVVVRVAAGRVWPRHLLAQGEQLRVVVRFSRPGPFRWLFGGGGAAELSLLTPRTQVSGRSLRLAAGEPVWVRFSEPVQVVEVAVGGRRRRRVFTAARSSAPVGARAGGENAAGEVAVAAAPRRWEQLGAPVRVRWFPAGATAPVVQAAPGLAGRLHPWQQLRLVFSQPLGKLLGKRLPRIEPTVSGKWLRIDSHTLVFQPGSGGFPLAATVTVSLPTAVQTPTGSGLSPPGKLLRWQVVSGSLLRLQQLLARLGYLPLDWQPADSPDGGSAPAQLRAALHPPPGSFRWRYPNIPRQLATLWHPGRPNLLTAAALLDFEAQHGLSGDASAEAALWQTLLADAAANRASTTSGYSYILVSRATPQTLSLWHNGQILIRSRVNAGTTTAPVQTGSYPIRRRAARESPAGASQPIRWISYFGASGSLHSSNRRSYGHPQSSDGIELPARSAYRLWPYTGIGTLITIAR